MWKNKNTIIISIIPIVGIILLLFLGKTLNINKSLNIPRKNEISFIEIYNDSINDINKYHLIEGKINITGIYNALIHNKKGRRIESVNDVPTNVNRKLTKIILTDNSNNTTTLFAYQDHDGKYYIEQPYVGAYEISIKEYEVFTKYFVSVKN